ncbi:MAG: UvrB/UvrC motif-containing protein [Clostridia bacterium]|nr:UvrB/UvrC motif-containing protein [Clostridia bacterium]
MLCSKCKTNPATFFYTQNINNIETSVALCSSCAAESGLNNGIAPIFSSLFGNTVKKQSTCDVSDKKCSLCALTFKDILSLGKVGCPECYNSFKEELGGTIRSIHGNAKHTGLSPMLYEIKNPAPISEEDKLKKELAEAITAENYERAATIRDQIKALKGEL